MDDCHVVGRFGENLFIEQQAEWNDFILTLYCNTEMFLI
jgi:hypothetical protein